MLRINKKAALELSVSTIVVLVIGMTMLVLGIVLVKTIFTGATDSVDTINDKVKDEITKLFSDEGADVVVKLGSSNTAKIKAGGKSFGVGIGARTPDGSANSVNRLKYQLTLEGPTSNNCVRVLGQAGAEDLFISRLNEKNQFDQIQGASAFATIEVKVPDGTQICTQKVFIDVYDSENGNELLGRNFFIVDIQKGLF